MQIACLDNLDLGCSLIRKAVMEKALEDVNQDTVILEALEKRKIARERGEKYVDEAYLKQIELLPSALRPQVAGVTNEEQQIYDDFGNNPPKKPVPS